MQCNVTHWSHQSWEQTAQVPSMIILHHKALAISMRIGSLVSNKTHWVYFGSACNIYCTAFYEETFEKCKFFGESFKSTKGDWMKGLKAFCSKIGICVFQKRDFLERKGALCFFQKAGNSTRLKLTKLVTFIYISNINVIRFFLCFLIVQYNQTQS